MAQEIKITLTKKELILLLDQYSNCDAEGIKVHWADTSINSIEGWLNDHVF